MGSTTSSLKGIIATYSLLELAYSILIAMLCVISLQLSIAHGIIYRADYPEKQLAAVEKQFLAGEFTKDSIPRFYEYQLMTEGEKNQTIPTKFDSFIEEAKLNGKSQTASLFYPRIFVYWENEKQQLVVSYRLVSTFVSDTLSRYFPSAELMYLGVFFIIWVAGFLMLIYRCVYALQIELNKVTLTNEQIKKMNLNYPHQRSKVREIQEILHSLHNMSQALKQSFQEQWQEQKKQKEMIQSITHDIRTPVTLIKGNLELLEETDIVDTTSEHLADLKNGINRLEQYIEQLKKASGFCHQTITLAPISKQTIDGWIQLAVQLTKSAGMTIAVLQRDESSLRVDQEQLTNALQNLLINSIDASEAGSVITLDFVDLPETYHLSVLDQGAGFSKQALQEAANKFFTTKGSETEANHAGMGLSIVKEIMASSNGELMFENLHDGKKIVGAKVTLLWYKP